MNAQRRHNVSRDARLLLPTARPLFSRAFIAYVVLIVVVALVAMTFMGGVR